MSYCRWSSDDFRSDVYVYENVSGYWTIHVASSKLVRQDGEPPSPYSMESLHSPEWQSIYKKWHTWYDSCEHVPIGLSSDGETYNLETPEACAATLKVLKEMGYYVPDGVIEELQEEQKEFDPQTQQMMREEYDSEARQLLRQFKKDHPTE